MKFNTPTFLTLFRVVLIPFFIVCFYLPFKWAPFLTALLFLIAAITDWFDGFLARRWNQTTRFGAFLDPVADKVMVAAALVLVVQHYHSFWVTIPAIVMISREIIISALREWMAEIGDRNKVAVSWWGKVKTTAQMISLIGLLWRYNPLMEQVATVALYLAAILTVWSMVQYLNAAKGSLLDDINP
ncbi:CDP-diacylglycerol--glycerol-3-phosphate 3-phosphatidyltransferase [Pasteurella testudinis DSM 23072]|uniref:CDP-diacylglycerol--glycerol-3-phosphate 3-phosphatidyltransferase n=1 Tax=Pasteurella testudinis DSM 23072 TaxID=1122938 RepID=A0A1W1UZD1_9PAST|nr:CDP-diacylglycerol--glycerol-3-phosphate 3-phosphatidyltransferase [Pasteurella testudinis]SMB86457.1 CDP-diacylglycerol--glycerol-3-phosphate 3-phosphatidyltransferase [Pasteurella testudinis DSM 23072]SUB51803.1 CDP-diacylglycerol--glycerol-3-phosphate 3-phosphatidyltransferase [Pasteurella testudinis]